MDEKDEVVDNNDSVNDFQDILAEETEEEKDEIEVKDPETENEDEEETEEGEEPEEEEEKVEDKDKKIEIPKYKEVTAKYPNLFKDFPHLKHAFFHMKEYREMFPTVEDAKEAVENLEAFQSLEQSLTSGQPEDVETVLNSIKEFGDAVLPNLAENFIPTIQKLDQKLYYRMITPEIVKITRSMFNAGLRNENDNLKNAALVAALHFFGDGKIASGEKEFDLPKPEAKVDNELDKQRKEFNNERYTALYNDVLGDINTRLDTVILDGIDPKNTMSAGMKEIISEKVLSEIQKTLAADRYHINKMNAIWRKAGETKFAASNKSKIVSVYIEAAKEIMPRIRSTIRAKVLGIRERHPEPKTGDKGKRIEPKSTTGGGSQRKSSDKVTDAKKVNWGKTSDLDFLKDEIVLKQ